MSDYYQLPIEENSRKYTAMITPYELYQFKFLPFGLYDAPGQFQELINKILGSLLYKWVMAYFDDLFIVAKTVEEAIDMLKQILNILRESNLTLNLVKCKFSKKYIEYLGFTISNGCI